MKYGIYTILIAGFLGTPFLYTSQASPKLIIKKVINNTPYDLAFIDRPDINNALSARVSCIAHNSILKYDYEIENSSTGTFQDYDNALKFKNNARFKIVLLDAYGHRKKGKSSYAHIAIEQECATQSDVFRVSFANNYHPHVMTFARSVEKCTSVGVDLMLGMKEDQIIDISGSVKRLSTHR